MQVYCNKRMSDFVYKKSIAMKKIIFILLSFCSTASFAQTGLVKYDQNAVERNISGDFNSVQVATGVELMITQSEETKLVVSMADTMYADRFKTEVKDGVLKIYFDYKELGKKLFKNKKLKAYLAVKDLSKIKGLSGARVIFTNPFSTHEMDLRFSSGAMAEGKVISKLLSIDVSSGAMVNISGNADDVTLEASSGAHIKGYDLVALKCTAKASSGGEANIRVTEVLKAKASSGGSIHYKGAVSNIEANTGSGGTVKRASI